MPIISIEKQKPVRGCPVKAVLIAVLLTIFAVVFGQSNDEPADEAIVSERSTEELAVEAALRSFFDALREARGEDAAQFYSSAALAQVDYTFQTIREGIRRADEATLTRLQTAGYQAGTQAIRNWSTREYLAETLKLPMMFGRYTPFTMEILSIEVQGRRATVQVLFENTAGVVIEQQAVVVRESDAWLIENFMGMTSFP
jgi:hypothetical protein